MKTNNSITMPYKKIGAIWTLLLFGVGLFSSCDRSINYKIEQCYKRGDSVIYLYDLYPEEWDSLFLFTNCDSYSDILDRLGPVVEGYYYDVGNRIYLLNKREKVVYYHEWFPYPRPPKGRAIFLYKGYPQMLAIPREKAGFLIRKGIEGFEDTYFVFHQDSVWIDNEVP